MKRKLTKLEVMLINDNRLCGDKTGSYGNAIGVYGDGSGVYGDLSNIRGNLTGIRGCATGYFGDLDECEITARDRARGVSLSDLVRITVR